MLKHEDATCTSRDGRKAWEELQEKYIKEFDSSLYHSYNAVMKGYVLIPEELLADDVVIVRLLNESYDYVMSLPGK